MNLHRKIKEELDEAVRRVEHEAKEGIIKPDAVNYLASAMVDALAILGSRDRMYEARKSFERAEVWSKKLRIYSKVKRTAKSLRNEGWKIWRRCYYGPGGEIEIETMKTPFFTIKVIHGHAVGKCARCGRTLTNPKSVARGLGPICACKY